MASRARAVALTATGFLIGVLWMDLMFDVQIWSAPPVEPTVASIGAYYRRVTMDAAPMGHLVGTAMLLALGATVYRVVHEPARRRRMLAALGLCGVPFTLAALRVLPARSCWASGPIRSRFASNSRAASVATTSCAWQP
jgi:hypothetical protein